MGPNVFHNHEINLMKKPMKLKNEPFSFRFLDKADSFSYDFYQKFIKKWDRTTKMTQKSPNEIQVLYRIFHSFSNFMSKLPKKVGEKHSKSPKIWQILRKKIEFDSKFFQKTYELHPENVHRKSWVFEISKPRRYRYKSIRIMR